MSLDCDAAKMFPGYFYFGEQRCCVVLRSALVLCGDDGAVEHGWVR